MPKPRTTGCKQDHDGGRCRDCNRIRVHRARALAGKRPDQPARLALTAAQRQANAAAAYVRKYLKRGAIAPPDACEHCKVAVQASPSRSLRPLRFFHPDPARPRLVAWLCADCRRRVHATGEPPRRSHVAVRARVLRIGLDEAPQFEYAFKVVADEGMKNSLRQAVLKMALSRTGGRGSTTH